MTDAHSACSPSIEAFSPSPEAFCTSGSSPTVHVLGAGKVGRALLRQLATTPLRVVALTDSTATIYDPGGLDPARLADHKECGRSLSDLEGAERVATELAADLVNADLVADVTPSDPSGAERALRRCRRVLGRGGRLALAAKDAVALAAAELLEPPSRTGINAVLGGTGARLCAELASLRASARAVAAVGNATTTALVLAIEAGASPDRAVERAAERGLLEADAELDLDGTDAATKLAVVAGALWRAPLVPRALPRPHALALDPELLRWRARRGRTTRLVARADAGGRAGLAYEELDRRSPLAVPADRVGYVYQLGDGARRVHTGLGLGPAGTAAALIEDLRRLGAVGGGS